MAIEVKVPTLGESVSEATIGEWLKQPGDRVKLDEPIASLETDKVAIEVPAPAAGVLGEHKVAVGETVEVGAVIATIEDAQQAGETTQVAEREQDQPASERPPAAAPASAPAPAEPEVDHTTTLSPAVRRAVLEHGVDPTEPPPRPGRTPPPLRSRRPLLRRRPRLHRPVNGARSGSR